MLYLLGNNNKKYMQNKKQLIDFIEANYNEFSNLECSEICVLDLSDNELSEEVIEYLKSIERFDHSDICIYYVKDEDNIWVENMSS
jgi:hypothetical protein